MYPDLWAFISLMYNMIRGWVKCAMGTLRPKLTKESWKPPPGINTSLECEAGVSPREWCMNVRIWGRDYALFCAMSIWEGQRREKN